MGAITAIGFDLGETLLTYADTPPSWVNLYAPALAEVAKACGIQPTEHARAAAAAILARFNTRLNPRREEVSAEIIFTEILALWNVPRESALDAAVAAFFGFFQRRLQSYPETLETLQTLRARRVRIGMLTDVPYGMPRAFVQQDLAGVGLESWLDRWLTSVEVGWRKPEIAGFHALAGELGTDPRQLWYVGNEEKDIVGARAAGVTPVLIDREGRNPSWGQIHTLRDLRELLALVAA